MVPQEVVKALLPGLLHRSLGYLIHRHRSYVQSCYFFVSKKKLESEEDITRLAESVDIKLDFEDGFTGVIADGTYITEEIRSYEVNSKVSNVSKIKGVRKALVNKQKEYAASNRGIVMEGRDIGTIVFPDADVKIF